MVLVWDSTAPAIDAVELGMSQKNADVLADGRVVASHLGGPTPLWDPAMPGATPSSSATTEAPVWFRCPADDWLPATTAGWDIGSDQTRGRPDRPWVLWRSEPRGS